MSENKPTVKKYKASYYLALDEAEKKTYAPPIKYEEAQEPLVKKS